MVFCCFIDIGIIKIFINIEKIISLMRGIKPSMRLMSQATGDSDIKRAEFLRNEFSLANRNKK